MVGGDSKAFCSRLYYPIIRRRHRPQFAALLLEPQGQLPQLGKNTPADHLIEEFLCRPLQHLVRDSPVQCHHLAAHLLLAHDAGLVLLIARARQFACFWPNHATLDFPVEKVGSGIAAPQRSIAVEDRNRRLQGEHRFYKLAGLDLRIGRGQNCFSEEIISSFDSRS